MKDRERGRDTGRGRSRLLAGSPTWDSILGSRGHALGRGQHTIQFFQHIREEGEILVPIFQMKSQRLAGSNDCSGSREERAVGEGSIQAVDPRAGLLCAPPAPGRLLPQARRRASRSPWALVFNRPTRFLVSLLNSVRAGPPGWPPDSRFLLRW